MPFSASKVVGESTRHLTSSWRDIRPLGNMSQKVLSRGKQQRIDRISMHIAYKVVKKKNKRIQNIWRLEPIESITAEHIVRREPNSNRESWASKVNSKSEILSAQFLSADDHISTCTRWACGQSNMWLSLAKGGVGWGYQMIWLTACTRLFKRCTLAWWPSAYILFTTHNLRAMPAVILPQWNRKWHAAPIVTYLSKGTSAWWSSWSHPVTGTVYTSRIPGRGTAEVNHISFCRLTVASRGPWGPRYDSVL